jgi:hypothetical protein
MIEYKIVREVFEITALGWAGLPTLVDCEFETARLASEVGFAEVIVECVNNFARELVGDLIRGVNRTTVDGEFGRNWYGVNSFGIEVESEIGGSEVELS